MKLHGLRVEPVLIRNAAETRFRSDVQEQSEVGIEASGGHLVQLSSEIGIQATGHALIDNRRIRIAIAQHDPPCLKIWPNELRNVLSPVGQKQEEFSIWAEFTPVQQNLANRAANLTMSRFAGGHHIIALASKSVGGGLDCGALARSLGPFKRYEHSRKYGLPCVLRETYRQGSRHNLPYERDRNRPA